MFGSIPDRSPRQRLRSRAVDPESCVCSADMCAKLLRFPDGAVMPQPVRRRTMAVSVQDWIWEELDRDRARGPQLVTDRRKTVQLHSRSTSGSTAMNRDLKTKCLFAAETSTLANLPEAGHRTDDNAQQ